MLGFFNRAAGSLDPQTAEEFGDGFLLEQGFTLLWVGWQFDPPLREGLVRVFAPIARAADGSPLEGLVRSDFVPIEPVKEASLADRNHLAYAVANANDPANVLTVRDSVEGARRTIPRDAWQFTEDGRSIRMAAGFEPGKIYEVVYRSQDPPVVGVGLAAVRDSISKLKYGGPSEIGLAQGAMSAPSRSGSRRAAGFCARICFTGSTRTSRTARCSTASWRTWPAPAAAASITGSRSRRAMRTRISTSSIRPTSFRSRTLRSAIRRPGSRTA